MESRDSENERIRERVRKLLNLAGDSSAQGLEIDNALRFARRLMNEHGLTEDDVRADGDGKSPQDIAAIVEATEYAKETSHCKSGHLSQWESRLSMALCDLVGTVKCYCGGRATKKTDHGTILFDEEGSPVTTATLVFYGPAEDVEAVRVLFSEWSATVVTMARMKFGGALRGPGRSYAEGFVSEIARKVGEIRREEREKVYALEQGQRLDLSLLAMGTGEQKAMILAERGSALALKVSSDLALAKRDRASEWLKEECGINLRTRSGGSGGNFHGDAYGAGRSDGRRAAGSVGGYSRRPKLKG